jgi:hypothetical protein
MNAKKVNESSSKARIRSKAANNSAIMGNELSELSNNSRTNNLNTLNKTSEDCLSKGELLITPSEHIRELTNLNSTQPFVIQPPVITPRAAVEKPKPSKSAYKETPSKFKNVKHNKKYVGN